MQQQTGRATARMVLILFFCALTCWAAVACGQIEESPEPAGEEIIGEWIKQLGDDSFAVREEAADRLAVAGFRAIPLLREAAAQAKQLEVRLRVQSLLKDCELREIDNKIAALLGDADEATEHDLPMWQAWRKMVGSDAGSRKFFASILKSHYGFLANLEINSEKAENEYSQRIADMLVEVLSQGRSANLADLGAIMLAGSDEHIRFELTTAMRVYSILQSSRSVEAVVKSEFAVPAMGLLSHWIERSSRHENFPSYGARLALLYQLDDLALAIARKSLGRGNRGADDGDLMDFSILVVAIHGSVEDIGVLEKWFADDTRCGSWVDKKIETQIRDVALAAVIELSKQNVPDFGFDYAAEKTEGWYGWYPAYSLGFTDDAKRQSAFAKWKNWQAATTAK